MPTNATLVLTALETGLAGLYGLPVYRAKRPVAGNRPPLGGWNPGWAVPCFVISANEAEGVDESGTFEEVSAKYAATVEFVKASAAKTQSGTDPVYLDDEEMRDKRKAVRDLFYTPRVSGVADVMNVEWRGRPVYEAAGTGGAPVVVSGQVVTYEVVDGARPA